MGGSSEIFSIRLAEIDVLHHSCFLSFFKSCFWAKNLVQRALCNLYRIQLIPSKTSHSSAGARPTIGTPWLMLLSNKYFHLWKNLSSLTFKIHNTNHKENSDFSKKGRVRTRSFSSSSVRAADGWTYRRNENSKFVLIYNTWNTYYTMMVQKK